MTVTFNPSTPESVGLEWLVTNDPSSFVLDSASKAFGQYLPGAALKRSQSLSTWAEIVSGVGVHGCEVCSAPYVEAIPQSYTTCYAGTDTGAEFTSPTVGGNAWLTQAGGAASYASVSPGVDDSTYLKNVNQVEGPTPARMMMRGTGAQTVLAGRRILDIELVVRVKSSLQTSPTFKGCLNISGIDYAAASVVIPTGQGYKTLSLGKWSLNPSTGLPWTVPELNLLVTTGGTDEFGLLATWDARYTTSYADTIRVSSVSMIVRWQPEDRCGYAYGQVTATGWQTWTSKSVPNLLSKQDSNLETDTASAGTWVADANTTVSNDTLDPGGAWTRSLKAISTASGAFGAKSGFYPAIAGKTYSFRCFANVTSGRTTTLSILFYDANGNLLQTSSSGGDAGTGSWKAIGMTAVATAPTGTTQLKVGISTVATAGAQTCYAAGIFVGLAQSAITFVRDTSPGGAAPTKVDGSAETTSIAHPVDELRIFRRISGPGIMSIPTFGPGASNVGMPTGLYSYRPTLQDAAGALLSLGAAGTDVTALITTKLHGWDSANGPSADLSQPYARRITGLVNTANTIQSEITTPVKTFVAIRLVVAGEIDEPTANLVLKLKKRSDNSQVGGNATITPTDLEQIIPPAGSIASRTTPQVFVVPITTPAATPAAQCYVEVSSTAAAGSGWVLYALDDMSLTVDGVSIDTITFGAGTDAWTDPGNGGEQARRNGMISLQTRPTAPTGVSAAVSGTSGVVTWTATTVGAPHAATEIWRDSGDGYEQIADLDTEADDSWTDPEPPRGVATTYELYTRRDDGSRSLPSTATLPITVPSTTGPWYILSSAEAPAAMHVACQIFDDDQVFTPPQRRVLKEFHGRDGAVAFMPIEDPLDEFTVKVALYWASGIDDTFLDQPPVEGRAAFAAIEALCRASISYVCIRDPRGYRWFANVSVSELREVDGVGYFATLHVRELTRTPSTPTSSP